MNTTLNYKPAATAFGSRVDAEKGIIEGMSVISTGEAKGHGLHADVRTLETCLAAAQAHRAGVLCKLDHGTGIFEAIGTFKNFRIDGDGAKLRADLHLLKTHPHFGTVIEMASTIPEAAGLSIVFRYVPEVIKDLPFIRVLELFSIDLVTEPALNDGMFQKESSEFEKAVGTLMKLGGISKGKAVELAVKEFPAMYVEWRNSGHTGKINTEPALSVVDDFPALVKAQVALGKTKGAAVMFCAEHYPARHRAWLASGNTSSL